VEIAACRGGLSPTGRWGGARLEAGQRDANEAGQGKKTIAVAQKPVGPNLEIEEDRHQKAHLL